jgi:hypothetical protein
MSQRSIDWDDVHNKNGHFRYLYDNGPGPKTWKPFEIVTNDVFTNLLGASATQQWANLQALCEHVGAMGFAAPDGTHQVHWGQSEFEPHFEAMPRAVGDKIDYAVAIQLEEA